MFSPPNAPSNNIELFKATDCHVFFYAATLARLAEDLVANIPKLMIFPVPSLEDIPHSPAPHYPYQDLVRSQRQRSNHHPHLRINRSPKPISYTNDFLGYFDISRLLPSVDRREVIKFAMVVNSAIYWLSDIPCRRRGHGYVVGFENSTIMPGPAGAPMDVKASLQL